MSPLSFQLARWELLELSRPSITYCHTVGIDFEAILPGCGGVFVAPMEFDQRQRFAPNPHGQLGAWIDAYDTDAETPIDAVAWPLNGPDQFCRLSGEAPALGMAWSINPASYVFNAPLTIYSTPLDWLRADCQGAVVLDARAGARWMIDLPAPRIATGDRAHARRLVRSMDDLIGRHRFVVLTEAA